MSFLHLALLPADYFVRRAALHPLRHHLLRQQAMLVHRQSPDFEMQKRRDRAGAGIGHMLGRKRLARPQERSEGDEHGVLRAASEYQAVGGYGEIRSRNPFRGRLAMTRGS